MVSAIEFAVRAGAGGTRHGAVAGDGQSNYISVNAGDSVSLNLSQSSVLAYERMGSDLLVKLVDGRVLVLTGYFNEAPGAENHLYLSTEHQIVEVYLDGTTDGVLYAGYGPVQGWEKWSPLDDLRFASADSVTELAVVSEEPAGMAALVPGLLGAGGGLGTAAAIGGGALLVGGGLAGGGGGSDDGRATPTVNPQPVTTVTTNTANPTLGVSGTGEPGDTVTVTIGGQTQTTTIGTDGTWTVTYPSTGLPGDGTHGSTVVVTTPEGGTTTLTGPNFLIDLTPPALTLTQGTVSAGDVENLAEYQNGVTIGGTGEAGASVSVTVGGHTPTTTVATNGSWSVTFTTTQIAAGEYQLPVTVTSTDIHGNVTTRSEVLAIDTVPHPITFDAVAGNDILSFAESQSGLVVGGTSTPGAVITLTMQGQSQTVTTGMDGRWSVTWASGTLPGGEYTASVVATTTDAAGNASSVTKTFLVDTVTSVAFTGQVAGDGIVNAAELSGGVVLTGTAQPGSTVSVQWNGNTLPATVAANGSWSVTFASVSGGTYSSTATVTATDAQGNTATATRLVQVDTQTAVAVNAGQAGGDNLLSGVEAAQGLTLTGTAEAGATVQVTFQGVTRTVTAGQTGQWSASWTAAEVPAGTYNATVQVTSTDLAGNSASTSHALRIDTEVTPFTRATLSHGSDQILNAAEATQGLTVTGLVEPGSSVVVRFGSGASRSATVDANGNWSVTIPAGDIPAGQNSVTLTATATDAAGNMRSLTEQVAVDTTVMNFANTAGAVGGDGILNAAEVAAGVTFRGTAEVGATVVVQLANGNSHSAVVGANGLWSVTFTAAQLPQGEVASSATVTATDRAGNTSSYSQSFTVDTVAPADPWITNDAGTGNLISGVATSSGSESLDYFAIAPNGTATEITPQFTFAAGVTVDGQNVPSDWAFFPAPVADGSYLVIRDQDAAGNEGSTLYIRNTTGETTVDLSRSGLQQFDFGTIDLTAADANLTLTEAQITALTGADKQITVTGDTDDHLTLVGATATATTQTLHGETFRLYLVGTSGASVLVDDDIVLTQTGV